MISKSELRKIIEGVIGSEHGPGALVALDPATVDGLSYLRVVTPAWSRKSRMDRIAKVTKAIFEKVPVEERKHIISVGVFTPEEWKERLNFARQIPRIVSKPTGKAEKRSQNRKFALART